MRAEASRPAPPLSRASAAARRGRMKIFSLSGAVATRARC